jgi:hypothetical protein
MKAMATARHARLDRETAWQYAAGDLTWCLAKKKRKKEVDFIIYQPSAIFTNI